MQTDFIENDWRELCSLFEAVSYVAFGSTDRKTSEFYKENKEKLEKAKDDLLLSIQIGNVKAYGTNKNGKMVKVDAYGDVSLSIYDNVWYSTFTTADAEEYYRTYINVCIDFDDLKKDFGSDQQKPSKTYTLSIEDSKLCLSDGTLRVVLQKFQNNSKKFKVFSYIMSHPDRDISLQEIEEHIGETLKDEQLSTYVSNLYTTDQTIMRLFFPSKSVNSVYFKSTVTDLDVNKMQHNAPNIDK